MRRRFYHLDIFILISLLLSLGCPRKSPPNSSPLFLPKAEVWIKGVVIKVEVAETEEKRQMGLMYRDSLPPDCGMLFIFEREGIYPFWMKDTKIPLDIAFIDKNKVIIDIQSMEPFSLVSHSPKSPFLYALEVKRGFFREKGIKVGDTVTLAQFHRDER